LRAIRRIGRKKRRRERFFVIGRRKKGTSPSRESHRKVGGEKAPRQIYKRRGKLRDGRQGREEKWAILILPLWKGGKGGGGKSVIDSNFSHVKERRSGERDGRE